jgi:hypothetical protein
MNGSFQVNCETVSPGGVMKLLVGRVVLAAMAVVMVAGCSDSDSDTDDFSLDGRYTLVMSGSEAGEPFESIGFMLLRTEGNVVSGEWRFDEAPVSVISGTVSGQITGSEFEFALSPVVPLTNCGTIYTGRAFVRTFTDFVGDYGGGCLGQEVAASFAANLAKP